MTDLQIAKKYCYKAQSSKDRGLEFTLNFNEYKRLMNNKRCYFTGIKLTSSNRTLDRVDNALGYVSGNVVSCCNAFNGLKALIENPINELTLKNCIKGLTKWNKR